MRDAVLVITNEFDVGADFVVAEIVGRDARVIRLNTERLPNWRVELRPGRSWRLQCDQRALRSEETLGVWWRRPEPPPPPEGVEDGERDAIASQWFALLRGLASVPGPVWISAPAAIQAAEDKARQLGYAEAAGLQTPPTLWTNDDSAAEAFLEGHESGVVKSAATAHWEVGSASSFVFAHPVMPEALPSAEALAAAPLAFQRAVLPKRDVRVTVVGDHVFAALCMTPPPSGELDWRLSSDAEWAQHDLTSEVISRCRQLVADFGLRFAAIDLLADDAGGYWFLEANPNGEWGWLQKRLGFPIAKALTDLLLNEN